MQNDSEKKNIFDGWKKKVGQINYRLKEIVE